MVGAGTMIASEREIAALSENVVLVATYWQSFARIGRTPSGGADEATPARAAWQVLSLIAPFLVGDARTLIDRLGRDYV